MNTVKHVADMADERLVPEMVPWHQQQMIKDHLARYEFATQFVTKKIVADMACGSGYGSKLLSKKAKQVFGIDISVDAVEYASKLYPGKKIIYLNEDVCKTSLKSNSVDAVVSFETLEHIANQKRLIAEVKRILRPGGLFVVSTPNILVNGGEANPFHKKELSFKDFKQLMEKNFSSIEYFGQKPMHEKYLKFVVAVTSFMPKGKIRWLVDSAMKIIFRGTAVKPMSQFRFGFVPAFFVAVGRNK